MRLNPMSGFAALALTLGLTAAAQADPIIIDNDDAGYSRSGEGFYGSNAGYGYLNDYSWSNWNASNPAQATWQFTGLTSGTYDVYATWPIREFWVDHADQAPYTVFDGTPAGTNLGTVTTNHSVAPVGITYNGVVWYHLGAYDITGAELAVRLNAIATQAGTLHADAVMIDVNVVPEPASLALIAVAGALMWRRRSA